MNMNIDAIIDDINEIIDWDLTLKKMPQIASPFQSNNPFPKSEDSINVVLSADKNYARYLSVTLISIIENSSGKNFYDIIILSSDFSLIQIQNLIDIFKDKKNFSIRFVDINIFINRINKNIFSINSHFSIAVYFRFFIPSILKNYKKILYLDCDLVLETDLKDLFQIDLKNFVLAAAPALGPISAFNEGGFYDYFLKTLKLNKPDEYFNSGVMLLNIIEMNNQNILKLLIDKLIEIKKPILVDQDILNAVCQNKVIILHPKWNFTTHISNNKNLDTTLSETQMNEFHQAKSNPNIIHYTSSNKPWNTKNIIHEKIFWKYAEKSPFYDDIVNNVNLETHTQKNKISPKKIRYKILSLITIGKTKDRYLKKYNQ